MENNKMAKCGLLIIVSVMSLKLKLKQINENYANIVCTGSKMYIMCMQEN